MKGIDWVKIKNEYINTNISQRALAAKYGLSVSTLTKKANKERWQQKKETQCIKIETTVQQKSADAIVRSEVNRIERINSIADGLIDKLEQATQQLESYIATNKVKVKTVEYDSTVKGKPSKEVTTETERLAIVPGIVDRAGLKQLASALKDIKDIQSGYDLNKSTGESDPLTKSLQELAKELEND